MAEFNKDTFRGLLVGDSRLNGDSISLPDSNFSQAGPNPGDPVPQADTDLHLESSGTQTGSGQLRVVTQRGGHPGGGANFRWKNEGDAGTAWRGWNPPSAITEWRSIQWVPNIVTTGIAFTSDPHAITLADNTILLAYHRRSVGVGFSNKQVVVQRIGTDGVATAPLVVYSRGDTITQGLHPCLMLLPSGRVMLYHYLEDAAAAVVQIQSFFSDDGGGSWVGASSKCLNASIGIQAAATGVQLDTRPSAKMRVQYSGGQVLMLISMRSNDNLTPSFEDGFIQYASADLGNTFDHVETWDRTINGTQAEITSSANGFEVFFIEEDPATEVRVRRRSLAYAYDPLSGATNVDGPGTIMQGGWNPGTFSGRTFNDADLAATVDDSGTLVLYARGNTPALAYGSAFNEWMRMVSDPGGGNGLGGFWELMGQGTRAATSASGDAGSVWNGEANNDFPRWLCVTPQAGRVVMFHNWQASTSLNDNSLGALYLGGFSTVTVPAFENNGALARRMTWDFNWFPLEIPSDMPGPAGQPSWVQNVGGVNGVALDNGAMEISTGAGQHIYSRTPTGTVSEGIVCSWAVEFISQGALSLDSIMAQLTLEDGAQGFVVRVTVDATSVRVLDNVAGTLLGSLAIQTTDPGVEILAYMKQDKITVFTRPRNYVSDRIWETVISNATLADNGGGAGLDLRFGHRGGSTAESKWRWLNHVSDEYACGAPFAEGFTNPDDLNGRPYGTRDPVFVDSGVKIRAVDGPTSPGDQFNIDARFDFPITNILPNHETSPRREWRSVDESQQRIAFKFNGPNTFKTLGLYLDGINWRSGSIEAFNITTSTWDVLGTIAADFNQASLPFVRAEDAITVNTAAAHVGKRYFEMNELAGATVNIAGAKRRRVASNTPGIWGNAPSQQRPVIRFDGEDGTEAASGDVDIWAPRLLLILHNVAANYSGFRLVIDASQGTVEGHYKIGQMVLGAAHLFTNDYSWGRTLSTTPNVELVTYRDGSRSSFKRGANRRSVQFGWAEGVDTSALQGLDPNPAWLLGTSTAGADVIGYRGDVPSLLQGILEELPGSHRPVVYMPRVPKGTPDAVTLNAPSQSLYGRIVSDVSVDSIVGDELEQSGGEVMRIATITVEEEL